MVLLTLYAGWRTMRETAARSNASLRLQVSWARLALLLCASGVWTFLHPMQMRWMVH